MLELHAVVHGMVQGVWFRAWTRDMAREVGVTGWVRNQRGGAVEVLAQGAQDRLELFLERLHDGPPLARVTMIDANWRKREEEFGRFEVRA
jgi:acylphosphatase